MGNWNAQSKSTKSSRAEVSGSQIETWKHFAERNWGNPFLEQDPLYALSEPIIDAIKERLPRFFTKEQETFERDLARTVGLGFFHRRALGLGEEFNHADPKTGLSLSDRHARADKRIKEMLISELMRDDLRPGEITGYLSEAKDERKRIDARKAAYTGWLVSNGEFRLEVQKLRAAWEQKVRDLGGFPNYPRWPFFDDQSNASAPTKFYEECFRFYRRWGLDRLATWDWPVPMEPDFSVGLRRKPEQLAEAGVVLIVPWYLLRGERLNLQGVIRRARTACQANHLWDWLQKRSDHRKVDVGDIRYEWIQWIFRFYELVLVRRYAKECYRRWTVLDSVMGDVIGRDADTIKRLRLRFKRE